MGTKLNFLELKQIFYVHLATAWHFYVKKTPFSAGERPEAIRREMPSEGAKRLWRDEGIAESCGGAVPSTPGLLEEAASQQDPFTTQITGRVVNHNDSFI